MTRACWAVLAALACTIGTSGCDPREAALRPTPTPPTVVVQVVTAQAVPLSYEFIGQTEASRRVEIRARVPGFIVSREYQQGGRIKAGDVLYRLDPRPFQSDLEVARAELDEARAELVAAEADVTRFSRLLAAEAGSQKEFDDALARRSAAVARIRAAEARIARGGLELGYTVITSPLTGLAGVSKRDVGAFVDGGAESLLAEVIATDPIDVLFSVSDREMIQSQRAIKEGGIFLPPGGKASLELSLLDGSAYPHVGSVSFSDIQVDPATGSTRIRGEFPNPDTALRPGQFVRGKLTGYMRANAITVPRAAVLQSPAGTFVLVVGPGEKIQSRMITTGEWSGPDVVVMSGLAAGDRIVVEGVQRAAPGMQVTAVSASERESGTGSAQDPRR